MNVDEDGHWKLGLFYYNREDRRVLVPKRLGFGRTLNMAKPQAWVLFAVPVIIAVVSAR